MPQLLARRGLFMFALILAGGKGERLRPLTDTLPKPMAPLDGKPILEYQAQWLRRAGVSEVVFLVGYRWEQVRDYFGDGSDFGIRAYYSVEDAPLGRGGAIRQGFEQIPETEDAVFALNGDVITAADPVAMLDAYRRRQAAHPAHLATIMVTPMVSPYGIVDLDGDDGVAAFREKVELPTWINAGVYIFDRRIASLLPAVGDHETETFPQLVQEGRIAAFPTREFWRSVDSFKDLREAEDFLKQGRAAAAPPAYRG